MTRLIRGFSAVFVALLLALSVSSSQAASAANGVWQHGLHVIAGTETLETFIGTSLINSSKLTVSFNLAATPATASGSYATGSRPPQVLSTFACTQIFKLS